MGNKTFIPAFKAKVGDWNYYICLMKYAEVARQVRFAYQLGGNKDLSTMIQRGISERTSGIEEYLLTSESRFLGAIIVAVWGGKPQYVPVTMEDRDGMLDGLDREFGVLTFDGTQQYFALDGQHRLKAIQDALLRKPELGDQDLCVLLVSHYNSEDGRTRTRRLFTNINRNAKATTAAENIALDVDDGFAILARRFLTEHGFLNQTGVVKVFTRPVDDQGDLRLAKSSIPKTDPKAFTTMTVLYDCLKELGWDLDSNMLNLSRRPTDEVLDKSYSTLESRIDDLLLHCGDLRQEVERARSARDIRAPKGREDSGHPLMRPVIQKQLARVVRHIMEQGHLSWSQLMDRLESLSWKIGDAPWIAVFKPDLNKMIAGKDFSDLLLRLIHIHLDPPSRHEIKRTRRSFQELLGKAYPVSEKELSMRLYRAEAAAPDEEES